jgi:hypothetical protein
MEVEGLKLPGLALIEIYLAAFGIPSENYIIEINLNHRDL